MSTTMSKTRRAEILLVEDNNNDVVLTRESFNRSGVAVNLHHVKDGEECMAFLRRKDKYAAMPLPDVILLDLNMPRMDGTEVLTEIAGDETLRHLPVVILTTSSEQKEILKMYKLRCSSYIIKPVDLEEFIRVIRTFAEYWLTVVALPS